MNNRLFMRVKFLATAIVFWQLSGCQILDAARAEYREAYAKQQNTKLSQDPSNWTLACYAKDIPYGRFNGKITISQRSDRVYFEGVQTECKTDRFGRCKATFKIDDGHIFMSISIYRNSSPISGFLDYAAIRGNMISETAYAKLECIRS